MTSDEIKQLKALLLKAEAMAEGWSDQLEATAPESKPFWHWFDVRVAISAAIEAVG